MAYFYSFVNSGRTSVIILKRNGVYINSRKPGILSIYILSFKLTPLNHFLRSVSCLLFNTDPITTLNEPNITSVKNTPLMIIVVRYFRFHLQYRAQILTGL